MANDNEKNQPELKENEKKVETDKDDKLLGALSTSTPRSNPVPPYNFSGNGNHSSSKAKSKDDNDGAFGAIVALVLIAAFIILMIVAGANASAPMTAKGKIDGNTAVTIGQEQSYAFNLPENTLMSDEEVVWYVDGKEVQRKPYSDKSALTYKYKGSKAGVGKIRVEAGNRIYNELDFAVAKPKVTVKIADHSIVYGETAPEYNYTVNGSDVAVKLDNVTCQDCKTSRAVVQLTPGVYTLTAKAQNSQVTDGYDIVVENGILEVLPKNVTLKPMELTKVYDGTNCIENAQLQLDGVIDGDDVKVCGECVYFTDKNVGVKSLDACTLKLEGEDAYKYRLDGDCLVTVKVTPRTLVLQDMQPMSKAYDGSDVVTLKATGDLIGLVEGDIVGIGSIKANFTDSKQGYNKAVTVKEVTLVGKDKDNYVLGAYPKLRADITDGKVKEYRKIQSGQPHTTHDADKYDKMPDTTDKAVPNDNTNGVKTMPAVPNNNYSTPTKENNTPRPYSPSANPNNLYPYQENGNVEDETNR